MKPWRDAFRSRAAFPYVVVALSMSVVVSCVTVASEPSVSSGSGLDAATVAAVSAEPAPTTTPAPTEPPTPSTALPSESPTSEPSETPAPEPTASAAPTPEPTASAAPTPEPTPGPDAPTLDEKTVARLQKIIDNQVKNKDVAGLQVAVRLPTGETWLGTAGMAEFGPDRALGDDDQMAIASITKVFISALILQLADEGKIDLDAPFGTYFRDAPRKDKVTVRQLLSHTSGIYNFWANKRYSEITKAWWENPAAGGDKSRAKQWTYDEMLELVKSGNFKPGEDYEYSNTNYLILGQIAEAVEGVPLHKQLRQRFFKPLGLDDTIYQPEQRPRDDAAHGHWDVTGGHMDHTKTSQYVPFMAAASIADAAGAMASTARDLSVWASSLYGGEVLSDESLARMTTFRAPGFYGLGTYPATFGGHRGIGHRGGIRGYESAMFYFPETGVTIVLLSNQGNWNTNVPMNKLVKAVLGSS